MRSHSRTDRIAARIVSSEPEMEKIFPGPPRPEMDGDRVRWFAARRSTVQEDGADIYVTLDVMNVALRDENSNKHVAALRHSDCSAGFWRL